MKKILLLSGLILGALSASAQSSCANALAVTADGSVITAPSIDGTYAGGCFQITETQNGGELFALWYKYTATANGKLTVSSNLVEANVSPRNTDTLLAIYTGTCAALNCLDGSDNVSDQNLLSETTFYVIQGRTYYISWNNYHNEADFDFTVTFEPVSCMPTFFVEDPTYYTTNQAGIFWDKAPGSPNHYDIDWSTDLSLPPGQGTKVTFASNTDPNLTYTNGLLTGLPASSNFRYYIRSNCDNTSTDPETKSVWAGPNFGYLAKTLSVASYTTTFEAPLFNDGFLTGTFDEYDSENKPFPQFPDDYADGGAGNCVWTSNLTTGPVNAWAFSRAIRMQPGETVTVSFKARTWAIGGANPDAFDLNLTVGDFQHPDLQGTIVGSFTLESPSEYTEYTASFTAPATNTQPATYYFGFNNLSEQGTIASVAFIDTITFSSSLLSVNEVLSSQFKVYPNPVNNIISLSNIENIVVNSISITDLKGRVVKNASFNNVSDIQLNVSDLASGVYMMNITSDRGNAVKKFIKN